MGYSKEVRMAVYVCGKVMKELKTCARVFKHETHAIKIVSESKKWMTVYARNRTTQEKEFEGSIMKGKGNGVAYLFRKADSLSLLGVQ